VTRRVAQSPNEGPRLGSDFDTVVEPLLVTQRLTPSTPSRKGPALTGTVAVTVFVAGLIFDTVF